MAKKPKKNTDDLTPKQAGYVEARLKGVSKREASLLVGSDYEKAGDQFEEKPAVQKALVKGYKENEEIAGKTREDVIEGILDAINMAKIVADPQSMIRGWAEIGKLCGHYAPTKIIDETNSRGVALLKRLESLSDTELLQLMNGRVIDGEILSVQANETETKQA